MTHVGIKIRTNAWINNIRYMLNRYFRPFIPNIIEIIVCDIINIIKVIYTLFIKPKQLSKLTFDLWLKKYE